ncbi:MAG: hypothetical protein ABSA26_06395 [Thermoguttaceae bacterium]
MIELAQSRIREVLARCRAAAYLGQKQDAIRKAELALNGTGIVVEDGDRLAVAMFKTEIFHLDGDDEDALKMFDSEIEPLLPSVPHKYQVIAGHNRSDILFGLLKPDESYYLLLDEAKIGGMDLWNPQALYSAMQDEAAGKPYESFPTVWQEILRTYRQGCWRAFRPVCKHMAEECVRQGLAGRAVYYAILAGDKEAAQKNAIVLMRHSMPDQINEAVKSILTCAQLKRHFIIGCALLESMADAIPNEQVNDVFTWLLIRAMGSPTSHLELDVIQSAWKLLAELAVRIDTDHAMQMVEAATGHPCWFAEPEENRVNLVRKEIITAVSHSVAKLPREEIEKLATKTIPLATTRKQDFDYFEIIGLLCQAAESGGKEIGDLIGKQLYPTGQQLNAILIQVAPIFGHSIRDAASWKKSANRIAENVRLQVQRVPKDTEHKPVSGSYMQHTAIVGAEKVVCSISDTVDLHAIFRHREWVPDDALRAIIDAILDMIESPDNLLENKIGLIHCLKYVSGLCSENQQKRLWKILSSFAKGDLKEPRYVMSWADTNDPMNPFKMRSGNPSNVRGISLFVLACLEKEHPGLFGDKLDKIIELGLADIDGNVRAHAFAAAREKPTISESVVIAILLGTRDSHEKAARAAFFALAEKINLKLSRPQWRLFVQSIEHAKQNGSSIVRAAAAHAAVRLIPAAPTKTIRQEMTRLISEFAKDICYSVRMKCTDKTK